MKYIPILFSTPMVQGIIEGRKTVTRRVITKQNSTTTNNDWRKFDFSDAVVDGKGSSMEYLKVARTEDETRHRIFPKIYPSGAWADERECGVCLWGRETWRKYYFVDEFGYTKFDREIVQYAADRPGMIQEVDGDGCQVFNKDGTEKFIPWRPSIFMPKQACRLFLQVESVRAERLQDITSEDAIREGIEDLTYGEGLSFRDYLHDRHPMTETASFKSLWQSINGEESWNSNPWVWRIEFKKIERPADFLNSEQKVHAVRRKKS